ncbi:EKC/KEOPS complex subunit Tprkb-like [Varroa jacobsoni]|uniref:EKC/KEOPS complex subunit Tprkb-like n=1 Tax=Varroa jacobsoni TaxID=62625 RepID=UPI000BF857AD|nr:EKC/KEOPS complex subunit Tprkb-like [Varroa jacobsoni]XP_022704685.1 EKC/KEOPS complex subunit Tprkb-like [Varroa jacobsoni]
MASVKGHLLFSEQGELPVYGYFFEDVTNTKELLAKAKSGDLNVCLVSSRVVVDPFQLQVAIALAVASRSSGQMKTKSIFAEILYCMSPSTSIIDSFKKFGVSERDSTLIAIIFDKGENIEDLIKGKMISLEDGIKQHGDLPFLTKLFAIKKEESETSNPIDSIVTRLAAKCVM